MRARNIKPGFFFNEQLANCCFAARLLFEGLWCLADREGRLKDSPRKIKVEIFPFDDGVDVKELLDELEAQELIIRYVVEGKNYIWIPTFAKHQNPHVKEAESTIPPYDEKFRSFNAFRDEHQTSTVQVQCKVSAGTVQAPDEHQTSTEQARLNLESGILNPDMLIPARTRDAEEQPEKPQPSKADSKPDKFGWTEDMYQVTFEDFANFWNTYAPKYGLASVSNLSSKARINAFKARIHDDPDNRNNLEFWQRVMAFAVKSDLCLGKRPYPDGSTWQIKMDWILGLSRMDDGSWAGDFNLDRLLEGKLHPTTCSEQVHYTPVDEDVGKEPPEPVMENDDEIRLTTSGEEADEDASNW